jgi:hypothetical protein
MYAKRSIDALMSSNGSSSRKVREITLTIGLTFLFSYLFNFVWEAFHAVWLYEDHDIGADHYVRMINYVSIVDALIVLGIFCIVCVLWRNLSWLKGMNSMQALAVVLTGFAASGMLEYRAVYLLKEWRYNENMPIVLGIGLSPLIQIGVTGLLALWLTGRLLYRKAPYSIEGVHDGLDQR